MFMNDSSFEDDSGRRPAKRGSQTDAVSDAVESLSLDDKRSGGSRAFGGAPHPNSLKDDEEIESIVGGDDFVSGARTSVIQQQRDLQKKKLQERMGGGACVRLRQAIIVHTTHLSTHSMSSCRGRPHVAAETVLRATVARR